MLRCGDGPLTLECPSPAVQGGWRRRVGFRRRGGSLLAHYVAHKQDLLSRFSYGRLRPLFIQGHAQGLWLAVLAWVSEWHSPPPACHGPPKPPCWPGRIIRHRQEPKSGGMGLVAGPQGCACSSDPDETRTRTRRALAFGMRLGSAPQTGQGYASGLRAHTVNREAHGQLRGLVQYRAKNTPQA